MYSKRFLKNFFFILAVFLFTFLAGFNSPVIAGDPHSAYYSSDNDKIFWFIHMSDIHIGTRGTQDSRNLQWIATDAKNIINPSFIVASGDLTDSTNGNLLGWPDGPHQEEWDEYRAILDPAGIDSSFYYDIPGNHEHYNDQYFEYYLANSIQGKATGQTQVSWTRDFSFGKYHFLGINTSDNTGSPFSIFWPWGDYAGLDENELAFINSELEQNQDADLTLIFGHHPVTDTGNFGETWLYYGASDFVGYMDSYGASLYGYGHTHRFEEDIFAGDDYTGYMTGDGVFYFNIASLGKSSENQYSIIALDCNGISIVTKNVNSWPAVLITAPMDKYFGGVENPYTYSVPNSDANPIRALVFDVNPANEVQYRIDGAGDWHSMSIVPSNPQLWEALWGASSLSEGEHSIEVRATSASGMSTDIITVTITMAEPVPDIKANCSDGPVEIALGDTLSVTIELDPGDFPSVPADWWCVADAPFGWYYYDRTRTWLPGFKVSYQGHLFELTPPSEVLNVSDLPTGGYTFYFGVDGNRNGNLDDPLYYDSVEVTITP